MRAAGSAWPTPAQELLLRAGVGERDAALAAWERWSADGDLDTLDAGSQRLLPLVYRNLVRHGSADPRLPKLKGVYRHAWYGNTVLLDRGAAAIRLLAAAGIDTLILKGPALATAYYRDVGVRPMADFDLLVRREDALRAIDVLLAGGWTGIAPRPHAAVEAWHATVLADAGGRQVDLHWDALWQPGVDDRLWAGAVAASLHGTPTRALGHADQLLHICVHGLRWAPVEPVRWVADALKVIEVAGSELEWGRLVETARSGRLTLPAERALRYLRDVFTAPVPEDALAALAAVRRPLPERLVFAAALRRPTPARTLGVLWDRHRRLSGARRNGRGPDGFATYLARFWGLERRSQLPLHVVRTLAARRWRQWR